MSRVEENESARNEFLKAQVKSVEKSLDQSMENCRKYQHMFRSVKAAYEDLTKAQGVLVDIVADAQEILEEILDKDPLVAGPAARKLLERIAGLEMEAKEDAES